MKEEGWGHMVSLMRLHCTHRLLTHSQTPTHRRCGLTSHLPSDRTDLMCMCVRERENDKMKQ